MGKTGDDVQRISGEALLTEVLGVREVARELVRSHSVFDVVEEQERGLSAFPDDNAISDDC